MCPKALPLLACGDFTKKFLHPKMNVMHPKMMVVHPKMMKMHPKMNEKHSKNFSCKIKITKC